MFVTVNSRSCPPPSPLVRLLKPQSVRPPPSKLTTDRHAPPSTAPRPWQCWRHAPAAIRGWKPLGELKPAPSYTLPDLLATSYLAFRSPFRLKLDGAAREADRDARDLGLEDGCTVGPLHLLGRRSTLMTQTSQALYGRIPKCRTTSGDCALTEWRAGHRASCGAFISFVWGWRVTSENLPT